jgi:ZIP family zinc transporter/zinc and cadmium transporter
VTISSIQVAGGTTPGRALASAAFLGAATVLGVLMTEYVGFLVQHGLALSAGVTIYVGASNLVPEFQGKRGWRLPFAFFLGAGTFFASAAILRRLM